MSKATAERTGARKSMEPWLKDEVEFYPFQVEGIRKLAQMNSFILADEMGLGKSLQALVVFLIDVARGWSTTCIIVCPATLKANWAAEIEKFTRLPYVELGTQARDDGSVRVLGPAARSKQIKEFVAIPGPKFLICNYEQVAPHLNELNAIGWDAGIFDEAHYLKNPKALRTKKFMLLRTRRSFMLTGTPMLNQVNELWVMLNRVMPNTYGNYWAFVNKYCVFGGFKNKQVIGVKNEKQLNLQLNEIMLRRLSRNELGLDKPYYIDRKVDLAPEQQAIYDEIVNDMRLTTASGEVVDIENALVKFLRLKQVCATTLPFTGTDVSNKLDQVVLDTEEILQSSTHVIVFTQFRSVIEALQARLDGMAPIFILHGDVPIPERQRIVDQWSAESKGIIVCMLQVAGVGLNMVKAHNIQFVDELFVPGLNLQAVHRALRIGQTDPVKVFRYTTRKTIENRIRQILKTKGDTFDAVVETSDWKRRLTEALLSE